MKRIFFCSCLCIIALNLFAANPAEEGSIRFAENKGQWSNDVLYRLRFNTGAMFAEKNRLTFNFLKVGDLEKIHDYYHIHDSSPVDENFPVRGHAYRINFKNANTSVETSGGNSYPFYENHYRGNDPSKWASNVKVFREVRYHNLYNGIDLLLNEKEGKLEYSFIIQPGAHPSEIRLYYEGLESIYLQDGRLRYSTSVSEIYEEKPYSFQEINGQKIEVATRLVLNGSTVSFEFPNGYNTNYPLVIDPVFVFGTFTGSFADNFGYTATYDNNGNFYAGGIARGAGYPTTPGAFQLNFAGGLIIGADFDQGYDADISITKYNSTGTTLMYSTYLGGAVNEQPHSLIVTPNNELLIYGRSNSTNYPVTAGAFRTTLNGTAMDIVVTKFNPGGTALLGSTFIGGTGDDGVNIVMSPRSISSLKFNYADDARGDIQIDAQGNVYVASCTRSTNFPVTVGAFKTTLTGGQDGCIFKMNSTLTSLIWSSYIGGNLDDAAYSIALDNASTVYVCGGTNSTNFPTTAGVPYPTFRGGLADGFIAHINATGTAILQSSYIGTTAYDQSYFVQLDGSNNVYLLGQTSGAFPVTGGVYSNPGSGQFIMSLTSNLSTINFSTVYGNGLGRPVLSPTAFLVDNCRNIYTSGWGGLVNTSVNINTGGMSGLPLTADAFQTTSDFSDFYFMVLSPNATSLVYGSYFGGPFSAEHVDGGTSRFDKNGVMYQAVCAGCGSNSDFPSIPGVWSQFNNSFNCNLGSAKIEFQIIGVDVDIEANPDTSGCSPFTVNFRATGTNAKQWWWDLGDGTFSTDSVITKTYITPGTYSITLIGIDSTSCDGLFFSDTAHTSIIVFANPNTNAGQDQQICSGASTTLTASGGTGYLWSTNQTTQSIAVSPLITTEYRVTVTNANGCADFDSIIVGLLPVFTANVNEQICQGESIFIGGGFQTTAGIYTDTLSTQSGCDSIIITNLTVLPVPATNVNVSICQGGSHFAGGANQTSSGVYFDTLSTQAGCDSIVITNLTVFPAPAINADVNICQGESYFVGGGNQTVSGIYFDTLTTQAGCDSVIITTLTVLPAPTTNVDANICRGESFFVGGGNQTSSGIYFDTLITQDGCDSIIITTLTVFPVPTTNVDANICQGESYFVGGGNQTSSGVYFDTLTTQDGCDSIIITTLTVFPVPTTNVDANICQGESYFVGGGNQTSSGVYFDTLTTQDGCDSIIITTLTVFPVPSTNVDVNICQGESYFVGGGNQTSSGVYFDTLTTQDGCDSIIITTLTVFLVPTTNVDANICQGESYFVGGGNQTSSGIYFDALTTQDGCDSIIVTALTIFPVPTTNVDVNICQGESYFVGGGNQTVSGIYFDTLTTQDGCDSIIVTALIVLPISTSQQQINICAGDSIFAGGSFQTQSGNYFDTLIAANGCDSIITTQLTVSQLGLTFHVHNVSCNCGTNGSAPDTNQICTLNFAGLPHGTILNEQYAADGIHISGDSYGSYPNNVIIFNSNLSGTPDPDLEAHIGNLAIFPTTIKDNNHDGLVDSPNDQGAGGQMIFIFDIERTVYSLVLVDNENNGGTIRAYGASNNLLATINTPSTTNGSVQHININVSGVRRLVVDYHDSRGVADIKLSCPIPTCSIDLSGFPHGTIINNQFASEGIHISGNGYANNPDEIVIFNSNRTGTPDPDLQVNVGNLLILSENITDNNGDGLVDVPNDNADGGTMIFTFDSDRTVYSLTLVDNDRNNGTVKAYDQFNILIVSVNTPSSSVPVQVITLNAVGVRRLEVTYRDSRGVTNLRISCNEVCCDGSVTAIPVGGFPPYQYLWEDGSTVATLDSLCEGTHFVIVTDSLGCVVSDSVTIGKDPAFYTNTSVEICAGDSVLAGGAYQTQAGLYYDTTGSTGNCPGVLVTEVIVLPAIANSQQVVICNGESHFAGGSFQTESGIYFDTFAASNGCDSVITTNLIVLPTFQTLQTVSICDGANYFAGGDLQTESGIYFDTLTATNGCDSVITTDLTVLPTFQTLQSVSICDGENYFAGGDFQTISGIYFDTLTAINGCDSVVTTDLMVLPTSQTIQSISICDGENYFAGGNFQTESGIYFDTLTASNGCDSVVTTDLTVLPTFQTLQSVSICSGENYFAGGNFQTESGIYLDTLTATNGCDSVITTDLTVLPTFQTLQSVSICDGENYFAGGDFQTISGIYFDTLTATNGCDSLITTDLAVLPIFQTLQSVSICDGENYFAGGDLQTISGIYFDTLTAANGCDSVITTDLTVLPTFQTLQSVSICDGENYFAGGDLQTTSGIYFDTLTASNGCDSILTTDLAMLPTFQTLQSVSICNGENYFAGGDFQTASGNYFDTLTASNGCDSVIATELTVLPASSVIIPVEICDGESFFAGGDFQTASGFYFDTLTASNGCDSVITTELAVVPTSNSFIHIDICTSDTTLLGLTPDSICALLDCCCCCPWYVPRTVIQIDTLQTSQGCDSIVTIETTYFPIYDRTFEFSICEGDSFFAGGAFQTQSGVYTDSFIVAGACDSIITIELTVNPAYQLTEQVSICEGESFFAGGAFQTQSGIYFDSLLTALGCDSVITTELTVNQSSIFNQAVSICSGESYFTGGDFQTASGTYFDTLQNSAGCDSTVITDLTVLPQPAIVTFQDICEGDSVFAAGEWQTVSGIYSDTFRISTGCDSIASVLLTVFPVDTFVQQVFICEGDSFFAGGGFQTSSGTYFDVLLSSNICDSIIQTELTVSPQLILSSAVTNVKCIGGTDGEIDLSVSGGIFPFTFIWSNTQTTEDISGLSVGQYSVTVTDSIGCSAQLNQNLSQPNPLALGASSTPSSCAGENDGAIDLLVLGGTPPYIYIWSTGETLEDLDSLQAGQYTVSVTDANGCNATLITFVQEPQQITLSAIVTNVSTPGGSDGAIDLSVSGGTSPYTYSWSNRDTTQDLNNLSAGTYFVTVADANGCEAMDSFVVADGNRVQRGKNIAFRAYPNPFKKQFFVKFYSEDDDNAEVKMFDIIGRNIFHEKFAVNKGENEKILKVLPEIPAGVYLLEFKMGDETKVVKLVAE